jgi:glycogen debranching enzyme
MNSEAMESAYALLERSVMTHNGEPVGTVAAVASGDVAAENYHDCFVRDFIPSALVFLADGKPDIVRNFLRTVLQLRSQHERIHGHQLEPAVLPASFRVHRGRGAKDKEQIRADFGDHAIGRVAPVDAMMWWVVLLGIYCRHTGDRTLAAEPDVQRALRGLLELTLREGFEVFPTLLVPDGSFMIDRRMGVYGHPLEIQALFCGMLVSAIDLLRDTPDIHDMIVLADKRANMLRNYLQLFYWLDHDRLNEIHRYRTEEFGSGSVNMLNIYPESIPEWVIDWLPERGGYLVGNLGPGRMDFRFFALGNLLAILFGIASPHEARAIMRLYQERWDDLVGNMPAKLVYPAVIGKEWMFMTGSDPKNVAWSYHNGGNWPVLLWPFVAAAMKTGRGDLAQLALDVADRSLPRANWPEYYDGRRGNLIGRRAHLNQVWSATGYILAHKLAEDEALLDMFHAVDHRQRQ